MSEHHKHDSSNYKFATNAIHAGQEPEQWDSRCVVPRNLTNFLLFSNLKYLIKPHICLISSIGHVNNIQTILASSHRRLRLHIILNVFANADRIPHILAGT